jgi:hypothetical protein
MVLIYVSGLVAPPEDNTNQSKSLDHIASQKHLSKLPLNVILLYVLRRYIWLLSPLISWDCYLENYLEPKGPTRLHADCFSAYVIVAGIDNNMYKYILYNIYIQIPDAHD